MSGVRRLVIVGGGLAGHRAAQAARRDGYAGELVVISDEEHHPYDRPPLSKQLLAGTMQHADTAYSLDGLDDVEWKLGSAATGLDTDANAVMLADGSSVEYDAVVLATGRRAREWPELPEWDGFHMLRDLDHTHALKAAAEQHQRAVIVGAGFIGCEVAATLIGLGVKDVDVIDVAPHPMPVLGPEVAARAQRIHESHGVRFHLEAKVDGFDGDGGRVTGARLQGGETLPADFVLLSLGSLPNTEWLDGSGVGLERGLVPVDEYTIAHGTENVAAAGDIALYPHPAAPDGPICIEHWSNARDQGAAAARNLLKDPADREPFAQVPTFWSDQYDVKIKSAGLLKLADRWEIVEEDAEKHRLVAEAHRDGELIGAVVFNKNKAIIQYTRQLKTELAQR